MWVMSAGVKVWQEVSSKWVQLKHSPSCPFPEQATLGIQGGPFMTTLGPMRTTLPPRGVDELLAGCRHARAGNGFVGGCLGEPEEQEGAGQEQMGHGPRPHVQFTRCTPGSDSVGTWEAQAASRTLTQLPSGAALRVASGGRKNKGFSTVYLVL